MRRQGGGGGRCGFKIPRFGKQTEPTIEVGVIVIMLRKFGLQLSLLLSNTSQRRHVEQVLVRDMKLLYGGNWSTSIPDRFTRWQRALDNPWRGKRFVGPRVSLTFSGLEAMCDIIWR